jgi:hypothetical protein
MSELIKTLLDPAEQYVHLASEYGEKLNGDPATVGFTLQTQAIGANNRHGFCLNVGVVCANIPHTWYNMYHGLKFAISFNETNINIEDTSFSLSIPDGNYDGEALAAAVQDRVQKALQFSIIPYVTFDVTYTDAGFFKFISNRNFAFRYINNNIYYELGFKLLHLKQRDDIYPERTGLEEYTLKSPYMGDLSGFHSIYMHFEVAPSNQLSSYNRCQPNNSICRIPIKSSFLDIEVYEPPVISYVPLFDAVVNQLNVTLRDDTGNILDLHGCDWSATLHFRYTNV